MASHYRIHITGIVQGVGFRPFVYALACAHGVVGTVCNNAGGVVIDCVLSPENLDGFVQDLQNNPPPAASIVSLIVTPLSTPIAFTSFAIIASQDDDSSAIYISPDLSLCKTCQTECFDPLNPRYLHPFINCTDCGSRYSIITDTPYDRPMTSMAGFAMCERCADEYHQPSDRRYHAEPICCPQCGPVCTLVRLHPDEEVGRLGECGPLFDAGQVGAVKGCGGFQICCDARDDEAIERIRILKQRPHKPFALMARSLSGIKRLCVVSPEEEALLVSSACPIVLLKIKDPDRVSTKIAPSLGHIGVMLPTTGLHQLLFHYSRLSFLLMTSANLSGEPLISEVEDLKRDLAPLLDFYIDHNRQIVSPIDDSVQMVVAHRSRLLRRARGYVPQPIALPVDVSGVVALGGQQKSCFALGRGREAFLGPHIGTLGYLKTNQFFKKSLSAMQGVLQLSADFAVHDLHPRFETTKMAPEFAKKRVAVQHHHAHHASCMAENGQSKPCLGLILDGSGYGDDGTVWGGELLLADLRDYKRLSHFDPVPLLGGEQAVLSPWRMALAYLGSFLSETELASHFAHRHDFRPVYGLLLSGDQMLTTSCGRLFDGVASLLGCVDVLSFEGQGGMMVESLAGQSTTTEVYTDVVQAENSDTLPTLGLFQEVYLDVKCGTDRAEISRKFINSLTALLLKAVEGARLTCGINRIVFSGGVFQNRLLLSGCLGMFAKAGFECLSHQKVPCNDGGLALGQLCVGAARQYRD